MNTNKIVLYISFFGLFFLSQHIIAQGINQQNFSNVRVDELTDDQIRSFLKQVESSGMSQDQLEQVAGARGMKPEEIQKLKVRVAKLQDKSNTNNKNTKNPNADRNVDYGTDSEPVDTTLLKQQAIGDALEKLKPKIYGQDLFKNSKISFEPNLRLATPLNYIIGTGDQLLIDIYGYSEVSYQLNVSPEGTINIPYAGVTQIGGLTIEAATSRIKSKLSPIYSGLNTGNTKLSVTLGNIRSIKVILTGEVMKPGTYTLPSLATLFNALYSSGGPTENGSFRNIEVIRNGRKIASLDVYDFLLKGELKNNIRLQDQDIIRIPVYQTRVEIEGEIKRPAIFEMKDNEDLNILLNFAGGFTERAYQARIKVLKNTPTERKINDITKDQFSIYTPESGDKYFVNEILDRFENRVILNGAVFRPGAFELEAGLTLKKLILRAEGLKEDAFRNRAFITRLLPDNQTELISFDLQKVMDGTAEDIVLKREDVISISSIFDLKEEFKVSINGEIRRPGLFRYYENMSLEELIILAGGLNVAGSSQRIEIARRVINDNQTAILVKAKTAEIFQIDVDKVLSVSDAKFVLQPFDIITIRTIAGYETQKQIRIDGEVLYPGYYTIVRKNERISDIIKRAGGLTELAYTDGASLKRSGTFDSQLEKEKEEQKLQQFIKIQREAKDSKDTINSTLQNIASRNNFVGINMSEILDKPGNKKDLFLEDGDIINIPKELQTVKVSGEVLSPNTVVYIKTKGYKQYILNAGGFGQNALKGRSYIIYANGAVRSTKKFLLFNNYPIVKTGSEIFIPKKEEKRKLTAIELVGITTGLASFGAIVLGILNLMR